MRLPRLAARMLDEYLEVSSYLLFGYGLGELPFMVARLRLKLAEQMAAHSQHDLTADLVAMQAARTSLELLSVGPAALLVDDEPEQDFLPQPRAGEPAAPATPLPV